MNIHGWVQLQNQSRSPHTHCADFERVNSFHPSAVELTQLPCLAHCQLHVLFNPLERVLFNFPSQYLFSVGNGRVLSLGSGKPPHCKTQRRVMLRQSEALKPHAPFRLHSQAVILMPRNPAGMGVPTSRQFTGLSPCLALHSNRLVPLLATHTPLDPGFHQQLQRAAWQPPCKFQMAGLCRVHSPLLTASRLLSIAFLK